MKEYKTKLIWKITFLILTSSIEVFFIWLLYNTITSDTFSWIYFIVSSTLTFGLGGLFIYGLIESFKSKLIITDNEIIKINIRGKKVLKFNEIRGYLQDQNYVYLSPKSKTKSVIKISQYFENKKEWKSVLQNNFKNIDLEDEIEKTTSFKTDKIYGNSQKERLKNIKSAKKWTWTINLLAISVGYFLLFSPTSFYTELCILATLIPIVAIITIHLFKGKIKAITDNDSPYPSLSTALIIAPCIILIRVLIDYDILIYSNAWSYTIISTPVMVYIFTRIIKTEINDNSINAKILLVYPFFGLTIGTYIFFSSIILNCSLDSSIPSMHKSIVVNKSISEGKYRTWYRITVKPQNTNSLPNQIETNVGQYQFSQIKKSDIVKVKIKQGLFNIPWYYIE